MGKFALQTRVATGAAVQECLAELTGGRVFIGCDPFLVENPTVQAVVKQLQANNAVTVFADVVPDPPIANVAQGMRAYHAFAPTAVIAIGGGSAIDTIKAVRYFDHRMHEAAALPPLYVMPSTSGTGSEVTSFAVITDPDEAVKYPLVDARLQPDYALLVPALVQTCPPKVCAYSGMDTMTHGLEALVAKDATAFTDGLANAAIELTFAQLPACFAKDATADYAAMQAAACIAGMAFDNAGVGLSHAIAHQLGSQFHVPHGLANAMLLPHIVAFNAQDHASAVKYAAVAQQLFAEATPENAVAVLIAHINALAKQVGCPQTLSAFGVAKTAIAESLAAVVTNAMHDFTFAGNPIEASKADIVKLVLAIV